jgi:hypothetical protein
MYENGILVLGSHNITLAHTRAVRRKTLDTYQRVLEKMAKTLNDGDIGRKLLVDPLVPLFKVR